MLLLYNKDKQSPSIGVVKTPACLEEIVVSKLDIRLKSGVKYNVSIFLLKLKPILENQGLIVKNISKKALYNRDYIAIEIVNHGEEQILMYTKLDDNNLITLLLINKHNTAY